LEHLILNIVHVVRQEIHPLLVLLKEIKEEQELLFKVVEAVVVLELLVELEVPLKMEHREALDWT
jgi:hypothetical protein